MRKSWRWSLIALAGVGVGAATLWAPEESSSAGSSRSALLEPFAGAPADRRAPSSPPLALPQRQGMRGARADLFAPPPVPPPPSAAASASAAAPPAAPPNPYRLAGTARFGEKLVILLARGDALVEAKQGEPLDDLYKVRSATAESVALVYAPLGIEQLVEAGPAPDSAGAAPAAQQPEPRPQAPALSQLPPGSPLAPR